MMVFNHLHNFRKTTITDTTILNFSIHPNCQKLAAYRSMIDRTIYIIYIANSNYFNNNVIYSLIDKKKRKLNIKQIFPILHTEIKKPKFAKRTYFGRISQKNLRNNVENKLIIAFQSSSNISKLFSNKKKPTGINSNVNKLCCKDCNSVNVAQTDSGLKTRYTKRLQTP